MSLTLNAAGTAISDRNVQPPGTTLSISYDPQIGRFQTMNANGSRNWPVSIAQTTSVPDLFPRALFDVAEPPERNVLVLFKACNCNPPIVAPSTAYGAFQFNRPLGADTRIQLDYFAYGTPAPAAALPTSGSFTYRWFGTGNLAQTSRLFLTQQVGSMTVDFAARTVSITVTIVGTDFITGAGGGLAQFRFDGTIVGNGFEGPIVHTPSQTTGTLRGRFFGPNGQDMAFVYSGVNFESHYLGAVTGTRATNP